MTEAYTLAQVEQKINDTYKWFAVVAPGTRPQETGELGSLWALFDEMVKEENNG